METGFRVPFWSLLLVSSRRVPFWSLLLVSSRISRCLDLAGDYSRIWIACRSWAIAWVEGERVRTVGATVAREPEATPASRKNGWWRPRVVHSITAHLRGSDPLILGVHLFGSNLGSRALSYRHYGGAHCPLIEETTPDQGMGRWTWSLWPSLLEVNSNIFPFDLYGPI
jgi:hypothetical protein